LVAKGKRSKEEEVTNQGWERGQVGVDQSTALQIKGKQDRQEGCCLRLLFGCKKGKNRRAKRTGKAVACD